MSGYTIDDTNSTISYSPPFHWDTLSETSAHNETLTGSSLPGSVAKFTFTGRSIEAYGLLQQGIAQTESTTVYSVSIDGHLIQLSAVVPSSAGVFEPNVILFSQYGLTFKPHALELKLSDDFSTGMLLLDYFLVDSLQSPSSPPSSSSTASTSESTSSPINGDSSVIVTGTESVVSTSPLAVPPTVPLSFTDTNPTLSPTLTSASSYATTHLQTSLESIPFSDGSTSTNIVSSVPTSGASVQGSTSHSDHTAVVVGCVLGGILVVAGIIIYVLMRIIRKPRKHEEDEYLSTHSEMPYSHDLSEAYQLDTKAQTYPTYTYPLPSLSYKTSLGPDPLPSPQSGPSVPRKDWAYTNAFMSPSYMNGQMPAPHQYG